MVFPGMIYEYCNLNLAKRKKRDTALHMLECRLLSHRVSFYFDCEELKDTVTYAWSSHKPEDISCGVVHWRDLVIKPGQCPFSRNAYDWLDAIKKRTKFSPILDASTKAHSAVLIDFATNSTLLGTTWRAIYFST